MSSIMVLEGLGDLGASPEDVLKAGVKTLGRKPGVSPAQAGSGEPEVAPVETAAPWSTGKKLALVGAAYLLWKLLK